MQPGQPVLPVMDTAVCQAYTIIVMNGNTLTCTRKHRPGCKNAWFISLRLFTASAAGLFPTFYG